MAFDKAKFLARFIQEAREQINRINDGFLALEKEPDDIETLESVFRSAHTVKGSSRMMKLIAVSDLAHRMEDVLDLVRQGRLSYTREIGDLLFEVSDGLTEMLDRISGGEEVDEPPAGILEKLETVTQGILGASSGMSTTSRLTKLSPDASRADTAKTAAPKAPAPSGRSAEVETFAEPKRPDQTASPSPEKRVKPVPFAEEEPVAHAKPERLNFRTPATGPGRRLPKRPAIARIGNTIRVGTDKLDEVVKLMGEMLSAHSMSQRRMDRYRDIEALAERLLDKLAEEGRRRGGANGNGDGLLAMANDLGRRIRHYGTEAREASGLNGLLINDLQDKSVRLRMMPLSTIFNTFPRTARDIARACGKEAELITEGAETELDKDVIEKLGDPMIHMIRNAIDHGVEPPDTRVAKGKPATGQLRIWARYEGGNAMIRFSDDGAGIPVRIIKEKAVRQGIITASDAERISDEQAADLIFHPGLSSTEIITDISGRGVGMDVVRKNIVDDLKGSIQVRTWEGQGTTFEIRMPLTMAIIHVLFVSAGGVQFTLPSHAVREVLRVGPDEVIDVVGASAIRLRDQLLPIARLTDLCSIPPKGGDPRESPLVLVIAAGNSQLGLVVDELLSEESAVIKPLPAHMKQNRWVSGCVISGDNQIITVLHVMTLIEAAKTIRDLSPHGDADTEAPKSARPISILVVDDSVTTREIEKSILESYGYRVTVAGDGVEGFAKARRHAYDIVVTDVEMPRMDGFTLTEKLREEAEYKHKPIILVTSLDSEADKERGMAVGADAYIVKGDFEQSSLLDTIRTLAG